MTHITTAALDAALPFILDAPKDSGPIETLCYRPDFGERVFVDKLNMSIENGVEGDRWKEKPWLRLEDGSADPRIQVCILGKRMLDTVWTDTEATPYPGDTIIADLDFPKKTCPMARFCKRVRQFFGYPIISTMPALNGKRATE